MPPSSASSNPLSSEPYFRHRGRHDGCSRGCRNQAPSRAHGFIRAYPPWTKRPTDWALALTRGEPSRRSVNGSETGRGCWSGKPLRRGISFGHSWSGRLTFTPIPDEHRYELTGEGTFERLLGVGVDNRSTAVVTPAGSPRLWRPEFQGLALVG